MAGPLTVARSRMNRLAATVLRIRPRVLESAVTIEERRRDREEARALWRDTQRQLNELTLKVADTNDSIVRLGEEMRAADQRLGERIEAVNAALDAQIEMLVSGIGEFIAAQKPGSND